MILPYIIDTCEFGSIVVNGERYTSDIIITQNDIISDWWRKDGHLLLPEDLSIVKWEKVYSVFIGTGFSSKMKVDPKTRDILDEYEIPYLVARTPVAVSEYNRFVHINKVGIFHLTC